MIEINLEASNVNTQFQQALRRFNMSQDEAERFKTDKLMAEYVKTLQGLPPSREFIIFQRGLLVQREERQAQEIAAGMRGEPEWMELPNGTIVDRNARVTNPKFRPIMVTIEKSPQKKLRSVAVKPIMANTRKRAGAYPPEEEGKTSPNGERTPTRPTMAEAELTRKGDGSKGAIPKRQNEPNMASKRPRTKAERKEICLPGQGTTPTERALLNSPLPTIEEMLASMEGETVESPEQEAKVNPIQDARYDKVRLYPEDMKAEAWNLFFARWMNMTDDVELGIRVPQPVKWVLKQLIQSESGIDLVARNSSQAYRIKEIVDHYGQANYGQKDGMERNIQIPVEVEGEEVQLLIDEARNRNIYTLDGKICDSTALSQRREDVPEATEDISYLELDVSAEIDEPAMRSTPEPMDI
jgi:hypothetical protein